MNAGFKRYLENLAAFHKPERPLIVEFTETGLGCTNGDVICINDAPEKLDRAFAPSQVFALGVFAHELLHTLYTNFDYTQSLCKMMTNREKKVFMLMSNLIEDSAIENFASTVFGGSLLRALRYVIKTVFDTSPPISESKDPFSQLINALIDVGDLGYYKGEFTFPEAKEMFDLIISDFYDATIEKNNQKRIDIAHKLMIATMSLWETEDPEVMSRFPDDFKTGRGEGEDFDDEGKSPMDKTELGKSIKAKKSKKGEKGGKGKKSDGDNDDDGDGGSKADGADEDEKAGESGKADGKKADGEKADGKEAEDKEAEDKERKGDGENAEEHDDGSDDKGDDGEDKSDDESDDGELSEEELKELTAKIKDEVSKAKNDVKRETEYEPKEQPKGYGRTICVRPDPKDTAKLNYIRSKYAASIRTLKRGLVEIFEKDVESMDVSTSGRLNVERYARSRASTPSAKIFDKRRVADGKQDVSILLLVDESGSMDGHKAIAAREAAILLSDALVSLHIPVAVVGFTADQIHYAPDHRIFLDFGDKQLQALTRITARCQNRDGPSIRFATDKLSERPESNKILFVISDGEPWASDYWGDDAVADTKNAVKRARKGNITVFSIGIGESNAWSSIYGEGNYTTISNPATLPGLLLKRMKKLINKE